MFLMCFLNSHYSAHLFPSCILVCQHIIYVHRLLYVLSYFYTQSIMGNGLCNKLLRNSRMWMSEYELMSVCMHVCVSISPNSSYLKWLHKTFWCVCVILEKINFLNDRECYYFLRNLKLVLLSLHSILLLLFKYIITNKLYL